MSWRERDWETSLLRGRRGKLYEGKKEGGGEAKEEEKETKNVDKSLNNPDTGILDCPDLLRSTGENYRSF